MPVKKSKTMPKEEGYVFPTKGRKITDEEMETAFEGKSISFDAHDITNKIIEFGKILTGISLYKYQEEAVYAIIYSVITFSGDVKTMLFSRQSGKSEAMAFIVDTLCVLLPALGKIIPDLEQFSTGFRVGLFAPQSDQVQTTYSRAMTRMNSANAEMVLNDPDINVYLESSARLELSNGSYLAGQVASKQSKIESKTYDLVIVEEAQDVDDLIVSKCYSEDTKINMPYGDWITIKDCVERKTCVMTPEGKIKPTDWLNTGIQEVFRIELCNGRHLDVTGLHRNLAFRRNYNKQTPFECLTKDLKVGDRLAVRDCIPTFGHYGNYSMGLVLGLLLGDGCITQGVQFCGFKEVWDFVTPHVRSLGCDVSMRPPKKNGLIEGAFVNAEHTNEHKSNRIQWWLKDIGVFGHNGFSKFIPNLPYSKDFLKGLICGLFEADGSVQALKKGNIRYASISKRLIEDISFQLQKFGVHCSISCKDQKTGFGKTSNILYELHIRDRLSVIRFADEFRLITKNDKLDAAKKIAESLNIDAGCTKVFADGNRYIRIKSIRSIGMKQTYCVTVPTKDHWIIANGIVSGNSIEPMLSSTAGTLIKVGTTGMCKNHFWYEIQHNRQVDRKNPDPRIRNHFEFDYKRIIKDRREQYEIDHKRFHLNYEADILRKKERWGEDSQAFRLAYALVWDLESGMLLTDKEYNGIINRKLGLQMPGIADYVVAGLDIGKSPAETVLTIGKVTYDADEPFSKGYKQILAWVALGNMDYESQHHAIMDCIVEFNISAIFADYTGVGKAVVDRLMYACGEYVDITPYTFTAQSKSDMWFNFVSEIQTRHLIVPANPKVRATTEYMKFEEQMKNCQKYFNGSYMVCEKSEGYFDDFVDSCLSKDTEVLTIEGFKGIDELTEEDLVASVNSDDYSMTYMRPLRKLVKPYKGDMIHFNGEHFEQLLSPHHRVLYERKTSCGGEGYFCKTTEFAEKVANRGLNSRFPVSVFVKNEDYPISDTEIRLIGWFITEAWIGRYKRYPNYYRYSIGQSMKVYPQKCKELSDIFKELSLEPYVCDKKNGMRFWQFHKKDNDYFDTLLDKGCHSMPSYWRKFSLRQMQILFNALMDGDGHWKSMTYTTQNKELAYDFSELCHMIGKACYVKEDASTVYKGEIHLLYRCYVAKGGYKSIRGFDLVPYDDRIWCVTVPTGYIVVRYKGKISVTGNCALMCMAANAEQKVDEEMEVMDNPLYSGVTGTINSIKRYSY